MATSGAELEKKLAAVRAAIAAGIDVKRNRQRERYLTKHLQETINWLDIKFLDRIQAWK